MSDDTDNVIKFQPRAPKKGASVEASMLIRPKPSAPRCAVHSFRFDPKDPIVECANCKCTFTAMDALEDIARTWTNRAYELKHIKDEIARKEAELVELKREVANLRAQKRRLEATSQKGTKGKDTT